MPETKLRIGIIGIGKFALFKHVPDLRKIKKVDIVAISRRDKKRLAMLKTALNVPETYTDWRKMLKHSQLDAVLVTTPDYLHAEPTIAALEHGLHVLVEKPMALKSVDAQSMIDAAEKAGRILMIGYSYRCNGDLCTAKKKLDEGAIGPIRQINLTFSAYRRWTYWEMDSEPPEVRSLARKALGMPEEFFGDWSLVDDWHRDPEKSGGGMFVNLGTHMVDLALWLGGSPPVEVVAFSESCGHPFECFMNVQARLENEVLLSIASADVVSKQYLGASEYRLLVVGELGTMIGTGDGIHIRREGEDRKVESEVPDTSIDAAFVDAISGCGENIAPAVEAARAVALTEAAYHSIDKKSIISLG